MKKHTKLNSLILVAGTAVLTVLYSCQKQSQSSLNNNTGSTVTNAALAATGAIQVSLAGTTTTTVVTANGVITTPVFTSGIYAVNCYKPGDVKDSVTFASLPTAIGTYLTANYSGYTFQKAFQITPPGSTTSSYVVVITYNSKPVALKFDASGNFVAVLEQREGADLNGPGWHQGGCFADRDSAHVDTIALSALPTTIKTYFTTNYPTDTLLHASVNFDASYVVISADNGMFATVFTSGGTFVKRIQVYPRPQRHVSVAQSALPAAALTYLSTTFPGYVFDKAFVEKVNNIVQDYDVVIDVNNTREIVEFDASGNFVKSIIVR